MSRPLRLALAALAVAALLLTVALAAVTTFSTRPSGPADLERARALVAVDAAGPVLQDAIRDCRVAPAAYGVVPGNGRAGSEAACTEAVAPNPEWYLGRPALSAGGVAEFDVLLLGLALAALAGAAGLLLGHAAGPRRRWAAAWGGGVGVLASGALWTTVAVVLVQRDLPGAGVEAVLQTLRVGALTALAAAVGHLLARRLGGLVPGLVAAVLLAGLSLVTPLHVLDLAGAWLVG